MNGRYKPKAVRRVKIPKPNGGKLKLKVNQKKSQVGSPLRLKFL
jgi:retron-type reverse transcriptase